MTKARLVRLPQVWLGEAARQTPTLLIVGPVEEFDGPGSMFDRFSCHTTRVRSCREVFLQVCASAPRVIVCERDLPDGSWKDILEMAASLPCPPPVIVTSRLADDRLWAEVLNLGGYDVLAKPLNEQELTRALDLAWRHGAVQQAALPRTKASSQIGGSSVCLTA